MKMACVFCGVNDVARKIQASRRHAITLCVDCGTAYLQGLRDGVRGVPEVFVVAIASGIEAMRRE